VVYIRDHFIRVNSRISAIDTNKITTIWSKQITHEYIIPLFRTKFGDTRIYNLLQFSLTQLHSNIYFISKSLLKSKQTSKILGFYTFFYLIINYILIQLYTQKSIQIYLFIYFYFSYNLLVHLLV